MRRGGVLAALREVRDVAFSMLSAPLLRFEPGYGFDASQDAVEQLSRFFAGGEAHVDVVQSYVSGDFVVLVLIERQHGKVGGLPDQDWSLRVTMLFRREADDWRLVHRHADPLVREIDLHRAAALARGDSPPADA
jgi:ketosteroid isomerase-like protein